MSSNDVTNHDSNNETGSAFFTSLLEMIFPIILTFLPFILVSFPILDTQGATPHPGFGFRLLQFFSSGEIVLPIFSVCGAMYAAIALNSRKFSRKQVYWPVLIGVAAILFSGLVLGKTDGFSKAISGLTNLCLVVIYIFMVLNWWRALYLSLKDPEFLPSADEKANALLKEVAAKKEQIR